MGLRLCLDGGGSKTLGLLFDDEYRLLASGKGGAANIRFETAETVDASIRQCVEGCLADYAGKELDKVYLTAFSYASKRAVDVIREWCPVKHVHMLSEGESCILAGAQKRRGLVALSGTGSTLFALDETGQSVAGGWGSWIGDEGSGYDIGRQGLAAAIREVEGRGGLTLITELVKEKFQLHPFRKMIEVIYHSSSPRSVISSVATLVAQAARTGDEAAVHILRNAGLAMAEQMLALIRQVPGRSQETIVAAGGAWKSGPAMFAGFQEEIRKAYPHADVRLPLFEPVMGGVIEDCLQAGVPLQHETEAARLVQAFQPFHYLIQ